MCCAAPRYWMVAVVCVLMCTTLCVEYIRVVYSYHPAIHTGIYIYEVPFLSVYDFQARHLRDRTLFTR